MKTYTPILLATLTLHGCAFGPSLGLTYHSDPEGATLYQAGARMGYTPLTLTYHDPWHNAYCVQLQQVQARWASGATAFATPRACVQQGFNQQFTILRPPSAPGAEIDASFAVQVQRNGILQQQADAKDATAVGTFLQSQKKGN